MESSSSRNGAGWPARVLVTGGAGFVGSQVALRLVRLAAKVTVLDDFSTGTVDNLEPVVNAGLRREDIHSGDVCDPTAVGQLVERCTPHVIMHLAAQARVLESISDPYEDARRNILGTISVAQAAARARSQLVLASSGGAIYGPIPERPARGVGPARQEDAPRNPISPYGLSKSTANDYLGLYSSLHALRRVVLNLANVYGPRLDGRPGTGFIERAMAAARDSRVIYIYGDGRQSRDFVFVDDVVEAFIHAGRASTTGVYNVGSGRETTVIAVVRMLEDLVGRRLDVEHAPAKAGEVDRIFLDTDRAWAGLRWRPRTSLREGLARTAASYGLQPIPDSSGGSAVATDVRIAVEEV